MTNRKAYLKSLTKGSRLYRMRSDQRIKKEKAGDVELRCISRNGLGLIPRPSHFARDGGNDVGRNGERLLSRDKHLSRGASLCRILEKIMENVSTSCLKI